MPLDATLGSASANSYVTLAEFQTYSALIGFDLTAHDSAAQGVAGVKATQYLERGYKRLWSGCRASEVQSLAWPRYDIVDSDGYDIRGDEIPAGIKEAQYEAMILSLGGTDLTPTLAKADFAISSSVGAGPVQASETFAPGASPRDRFTAIEGLLADFVTGHPGATAWTGQIRR